MSRNILLLTVSVISLATTIPIFAQTQSNNPGQTQTRNTLNQDANEAWNDIKEDSAEAYESIKATVLGETDTPQKTTVTIDSRMTAAGMIGKGRLL
ncbi:MAG: hypothetical protein K9G62_03465 [Alphaproteobacteria bacterium]|nr:hypothetical protein [Alphaproteobacteria bacterium]